MIFWVFLLMPAVARPAQQKHAQKAAPKALTPQKKHHAPMRGRLEKLSCKLGTEDRQARIAVELIGGRLKSLAYYSKWKPRTCSVYIVRDDAWSKWEDTGGVTVVTLNEEKGAFLIDYSRTAVKFLFRDIDRERFCGMPGKITGSLTVTRGRDQCELEGVMDEYVEPNLEPKLEIMPEPKPVAAPASVPVNPVSEVAPGAVPATPSPALPATILPGSDPRPQ